jgi:hypothetical protein
MPHSLPARLPLSKHASLFPSMTPTVKACLTGSQQGFHCQSMPHSFPARLTLSKHASQFPSKALTVKGCRTCSFPARLPLSKHASQFPSKAPTMPLYQPIFSLFQPAFHYPSLPHIIQTCLLMSQAASKYQECIPLPSLLPIFPLYFMNATHFP